MPLGLVIRGLTKGYMPPVPFAVVSLVFTLGLLTAWRAGYAALSPKEVDESKMTPSQRAARRKDRKGNPFEFMQLVFSLVKRW